MTPDVSSVGMMERKPLPTPHSEKRSPIRVRSAVPVVWCPVRTSARSNFAATLCTHARVYSDGCVSGRCVSNFRGRKHGSPASNLKPSTPCLSWSDRNRDTNQSTASGFVTSSATTGGAFHHLKNPGFSPFTTSNGWCGCALSTKYPAADPSRYASVSSSMNGITHSVTLNPIAWSSSTMRFGSGNFTGSKSSSPYPTCHLSSISMTLPGSLFSKISRANSSVFL
mmetsp:Transcript_8471/g.31013  ORF Transcript_8471/g.31013 Transcript_8471/m.31013 type:complete len:225 (-) Transcript_8471:3086-3760(-)